MFKSLRRSLIEFILLMVLIGVVILFFDFPVWVDIVIILPFIILGMLSITIEKKVGKEGYKFLMKSSPSYLVTLCFFIPIFLQISLPKFWNRIGTFKDVDALFIFYLIGTSIVCFYAGMLSVILKNQKDQKEIANDPKV